MFQMVCVGAIKNTEGFRTTHNMVVSNNAKRRTIHA